MKRRQRDPESQLRFFTGEPDQVAGSLQIASYQLGMKPERLRKCGMFPKGRSILKHPGWNLRRISNAGKLVGMICRRVTPHISPLPEENGSLKGLDARRTTLRHGLGAMTDLLPIAASPVISSFVVVIQERRH
ncbi:hypothetical protein GCM10019059_08290 [Camelimonas fluminis]|uniref:hypothetical protein n=1 Tax=Camelimonas fluminis TaxID=1576911 RepID=UPI001749EDBC|nr:hypothetical protein [Camelimonas fluminis]GHE51371.1 hypothetical protein GCM10019059_08290 [Camelimonas fluminis]